MGVNRFYQPDPMLAGLQQAMIGFNERTQNLRLEGADRQRAMMMAAGLVAIPGAGSLQVSQPLPVYTTPNRWLMAWYCAWPVAALLAYIAAVWLYARFV